MELKDILSKCDHTLLAQTATWDEIKAICDDGMKYGCASVCIPASYVKQAAEYVAGKLPICTVIGFPNGYDTTAAKCFMATDAVNNGAEEVDMVINLGWVKDRKWEDLLSEIKAIKEACHGKLLKVIIECCARSSPTPAQTTSRPPPASAVAAPPVRTWPCSPSTWAPM